MSDLPKELEPTADNNEVLRAARDNDEVDYRIDPTMMQANLRKTPLERLLDAGKAAASLHDFRERIRRFNKS
jgi:hypothetical protein